MLNTRMTVFGGRETEQILRELPKSVQRKALLRALRAGAKPILDDARSRVQSETVRRALGVVVTRSGQTGHQAALQVTPRRGGARGTPTNLPLWIEYGTNPRFQKTTGRYTGAMPARPYLRPAFDTKRRQALDAILGELRAAIELEANKATARLIRRRARGR